MTMIDPVEKLLAIEDIKTLRARYWRYVDTKKWPEFTALFVADATFEDHAADFRCENAEEIGTKIPQSLTGVFSAHHGHQHEITIEDEDHATGIWAMFDYLIFSPGTAFPGAPSAGVVRGYGHYFDEYVRIKGQWRFAKVDLYRLRLESGTATSTEYPLVPTRAGAGGR
jgi:hypothetical protein